MKGIILAGGSGTRLYPVTRSISKQLLPINVYTSIVAMFINIILNIVLIPFYSFLGAAIATSMAYSLNTLMRIGLYKKVENDFSLKKLIISQTDIKYLIEKGKKVI